MRLTRIALAAASLLLAISTLVVVKSGASEIFPEKARSLKAGAGNALILAADQTPTASNPNTPLSARIDGIGPDFIVANNATFHVSGITSITNINGVPTALRRLVGGSLVSLEYHRDDTGRYIADSISVIGPPLPR